MELAKQKKAKKDNGPPECDISDEDYLDSVDQDRPVSESNQPLGVRPRAAIRGNFIDARFHQWKGTAASGSTDSSHSNPVLEHLNTDSPEEPNGQSRRPDKRYEEPPDNWRDTVRRHHTHGLCAQHRERRRAIRIRAPKPPERELHVPV